MAFRKSYGTRKMGARKTYRKTSTYRKVTKPARQAIPALQRQVNSLRKAVKPITQNKLFYRLTRNQGIGNVTGDSVTVQNLSKCSDWVRVFGTDADDESSHAFQQQTSNLRWQIVTNGEAARINYTIAVVSLKKNAISELWNAGLGTLNSLTADVHYTRVPSFNGMGVYLNKQYFNIHYYRTTWTMSTSGYPGEGIPTRQGKISLKPRMFKNPLGDWKAYGTNPDPSSNMFLLTFCNDSTADASVFFQVNYLTSGVAV